MPLSDMLWGDRMGQVTDRWGNQWTLASHTKDVTPEEMKVAHDALLARMQSQKQG